MVPLPTGEWGSFVRALAIMACYQTMRCAGHAHRIAIMYAGRSSRILSADLKGCASGSLRSLTGGATAADAAAGFATCSLSFAATWPAEVRALKALS